MAPHLSSLEHSSAGDGAEFATAVARALQVLLDGGVTCFNAAVYHPPLPVHPSSHPRPNPDVKPDADGLADPTDKGFGQGLGCVVARIVDRSTQGGSDIGSFELFGPACVATDPYQVIALFDS